MGLLMRCQHNADRALTDQRAMTDGRALNVHRVMTDGKALTVG
jgi:hypothetical protein